MTLSPLLASLEDLARTNKARAVMTIKDFNAIIHALIATRDEGVRARLDTLLSLPLAHEWFKETISTHHTLKNMAEHVLLTRSYKLLNFYHAHFGNKVVLDSLSDFGVQNIALMRPDDIAWLRAFEETMGICLFNKMLFCHLGDRVWREALRSYFLPNLDVDSYLAKELDISIFLKIKNNRRFHFTFSNPSFLHPLYEDDINLLADVLRQHANPTLLVSNSQSLWAQAVLVAAHFDNQSTFPKFTQSFLSNNRFIGLDRDVYFHIMSQYLLSQEGSRSLMERFCTFKGVLKADSKEQFDWIQSIILSFSKVKDDAARIAFPRPSYGFKKTLSHGDDFSDKTIKNINSYMSDAASCVQSRLANKDDIASWHETTSDIKALLEKNLIALKTLHTNRKINNFSLLKLCAWGVGNKHILDLALSTITPNFEHYKTILDIFMTHPTKEAMKLFMLDALAYDFDISLMIKMLNCDMDIDDKVDILSQSFQEWRRLNPSFPYGYVLGKSESVVDSGAWFDLNDGLLKEMILTNYKKTAPSHPWTRPKFGFSAHHAHNISSKAQSLQGLFFLIHHDMGMNLDRDYPEISYKNFILKKIIDEKSSHDKFRLLTHFGNIAQVAQMPLDDIQRLVF